MKKLMSSMLLVFLLQQAGNIAGGMIQAATFQADYAVMGQAHDFLPEGSDPSGMASSG